MKCGTKKDRQSLRLGSALPPEPEKWKKEEVPSGGVDPKLSCGCKIKII